MNFQSDDAPFDWFYTKNGKEFFAEKGPNHIFIVICLDVSFNQSINQQINTRTSDALTLKSFLKRDLKFFESDILGCKWHQ